MHCFSRLRKSFTVGSGLLPSLQSARGDSSLAITIPQRQAISGLLSLAQCLPSVYSHLDDDYDFNAGMMWSLLWSYLSHRLPEHVIGISQPRTTDLDSPIRGGRSSSKFYDLLERRGRCRENMAVS